MLHIVCNYEEARSYYDPVTPTTIDRPARRQLTRGEKASLVRTLGFVLFLHLVGWGLLVGVVAPHDYQVGGKVLGVGLGLTAYTLGMRHAFDADHIAAIDNTTRKLMAEGKRPMSVGFWFCLGHSSVVFVMVMRRRPRRAGALRRASTTRTPRSSSSAASGAPWSAGCSCCSSAWSTSPRSSASCKVFREMRQGRFDEAELERQLDNRGLLNRILGRVTRAVTKPWHMYPIGLLFGLGFDTVTEVGLLVIAGGAAAASLPW